MICRWHKRNFDNLMVDVLQSNSAGPFVRSFARRSIGQLVWLARGISTPRSDNLLLTP